MKKIKNWSLAVLLSSLLILPSCIGSFNLTKTVYEWNNQVGDKFVNELVFLVCFIVPVYPVSTFVDAVVLNSVEFWTGANPMAMKSGEQKIKTIEIDGKSYQLTAERNKMTIEEKGSINAKTEMIFREEDNSWYLRKGNKLQKLVEVDIENGDVSSYRVYYPDGSYSVLSSGFNQMALKTQMQETNDLAVR